MKCADLPQDPTWRKLRCSLEICTALEWGLISDPFYASDIVMHITSVTIRNPTASPIQNGVGGYPCGKWQGYILDRVHIPVVIHWGQ